MVKPDKIIKKEFKLKASKEPEKYYPIAILKKEGYYRNKCKVCGTYFWSTNKEREVCGDANCSGGFSFFNNNPAKKKLSYIEVWKLFSKMFKNKGYEVINRYPVVARWNPTTEFTIASIAAFQPYVVNGSVAPPAKKLVIPQFCLRFGDIDNVGVTMSHFTGFVMIGQHMFLPKEEWNQEKAFRDIFDWLLFGLGLPKEEIIFHEDAWAGGGNFGPCMEFFCRGVELGNQVYMMYEQINNGFKELKLKVLDMGMGHERNAWFSQGEKTIYDATFPDVMKKLLMRTKFIVDDDLLKKYVPHAAFLNLDEVDNLDEAWLRVSKKIGVDINLLKEKIAPLTALYSIAEHSRSLLFALNDGALPSNTGGGYNLRTIFRRAMRFIEVNNWDLSLEEVAEWHAIELEPLFPELKKNIEEVKKILVVEKEKYFEAKEKAKRTIALYLNKTKNLSDKNEINNLLLELYDSHGIMPEDFIKEAKKIGLEIKKPDNFYQLVTEKHNNKKDKETKTATKKKVYYDLGDLPKTEILYYGPHDAILFNARVLKIKEYDNNYLVVLDKTAFYPTSGGQEHDTGFLNNNKVIDVFKQDSIIIHVLNEKPSFKEGDTIVGKVDFDRRLQLSQNHTATHIINGAARKVLGNHVWQAGASKTVEKARIDITHYKPLTEEELKAIEEEANKIIKEGKPILKELIPKTDAEKKYGFRLYQGGAIPGDKLRIVDINGFDVEACGGTHLDNTKDVELIKIIKSTKISDSIVRIEFVAGNAAKRLKDEEEKLLLSLEKELNCSKELIPCRAEELFKNWKLKKKKKPYNKSFNCQEKFEGDILIETAKRLKTQVSHLLKTIKRFKKELDN